MAAVPADKEFTMETRHVLPAHFLVRIESFSLLMEKRIQQFESKRFAAGDYNWRLIICLDGDKSENGDGHFSVYLSVADTSSLPLDWEVNAMFNVFLYNQIQDNCLCFRGKLRRFHSMNSQWGFSKIISTKMLREPSNGYLIDDKCVFGAEVFVVKSQRTIECVSLLKVANVHKHGWTIEQFSKVKDEWTSEEFNVGDHRWKFKLYPNGNGSGKGHSVSIYLHCLDASDQKVGVDFCCRLKDNLHLNHHSKKLSHCFTSSQIGWGWPHYLSLDDMREPSKGFVVDDCCVLETEIIVDVDADSIRVDLDADSDSDGPTVENQPQPISPLQGPTYILAQGE